MKLISDDGGEVGCGGGGRKKVLVGVKLDHRSRELLTWALVKVAESGDVVIALHVLETVTAGTAQLLSLVKTFDSVLSVYEGFCNLKQVRFGYIFFGLFPLATVTFSDFSVWMPRKVKRKRENERLLRFSVSVSYDAG